MKMALSIESAGVHSALRDSIVNSTSSAQQESSENITNKIIAIAKKILLTKIEYEEVNNYDQSVLDSFKSKYTVLKPYNNGKLLTSQGENIANSAFEKNGSLCNTLSYQHQINQKNTSGLPQAKRILFPRDSVRVGWRSSGRKWQIGSGMMNVGNTCYLNSTLQALFHVPAMANWLISDSEHRDECRGENNMQDGCIICAMAKTLIYSQVSSSAIRPQLVYSRLKQICKHLIFGRQEDAHEFLRYLVEAMEKSYLQRFKNYKELDQYSKETTPLNQILGGYLKTSVRCLSCGHVSTTFQHFQDLLLDIRKPNTIEEALDGYFAKERLEDMGYKCESCKKKVSAIKQFTLERAPISLCIQLKRFSMVGTKINKYISIRPRLDLTKYATNKSGNESLSYKLVAMVTHLGASQHCGHYTAIGLTDQGGYYQFDDSCVRPISLPNVLNTNAYIIFYELDENQQSKPVCTQVSGENEIFKNDILKNNENSLEYQKNSDNGTSHNENSGKNINGLFSPKVISKVEFAQESEKETNNDLSNNNHFIGPQLPPEMLKEGSLNNNVQKKDTQICSDIKSTANNQLKQIENVSSSSKLSTNASKILVKSSSSNTSGNFDTSEIEKNGYENINKKETSTNKISNNNLKPQQLAEENCSRSCSEITCKKEEKQNVEIKSLLPSMPKLDSNFENSAILNANNSSNLIGKTPTKQSPSWVGPLSPNYMMKQNYQNDGDKSLSMSNGIKKSPIKSLVPYGSDADEDSADSSDNEIAKKNKLDENSQLKDKENNNSPFIKLNGEVKKCGFSTSNETSPEASPETNRVKSSTSSPHIVKTKAGLWQVTPITPSGSPKADTEPKEENNTTKTFSNPFNSHNTPIPTSMFYSDKNSNSIYTKKEEKSPTIKELTKYSHRGYGASVLSWNGTKSEMEIVVTEEARQERKRQMYNDEENEIDRGRQKKVKNLCNRQNDSNPGYNPFQEQQLQKNSEHIRRNWIMGNNSNKNSNKLNNSIRYHYQNNFNNSHSFDVSVNSNDNINCNANFSNKISNGKNNYNNNNKDTDSNNDNNKYKNDSNSNSIIQNNDSNCNNRDSDNINNNYNKFSNKFNAINKINNHSHNTFSNKSNIINKNNKNNSNNFFRNDIINTNYNNHNSNNNSNNNNSNSHTNNQYNKVNNIGSSKIYNQHNFLNRIHSTSSNCFRRHNSKRFNLNQRLINHQKGGEWR